jgi:hypothetical protein
LKVCYQHFHCYFLQITSVHDIEILCI